MGWLEPVAHAPNEPCLYTQFSGSEKGAAGREVLDGTGRYIYTDDLRRLSQLRPAVAPTIPPALSVIATPLRWQVWESELRGHPDREFVQLVVGGIRDGFRIGYDYSRH